jgi:hypothetical protein
MDINLVNKYNYTANFARPFFRLALIIRRPALEDIRLRKPEVRTFLSRVP